TSWLDLRSNGKLKIDKARPVIKKCLKVLLAYFRSRALGFQDGRERGTAFLICRQCNRSRLVRFSKDLAAEGFNLLARGLKCLIRSLDLRQSPIACQLELRLGAPDI